MGGAFGGKETQGNLFAVVAALVAKEAGRAAKIRPDRDDDFVITGKRHDFLIDSDVGFDDAGRILAVDMTYAARCGWSADLSELGRASCRARVSQYVAIRVGTGFLKNK